MHRSSSSTAPVEDKENTPPRSRQARKRPVEAEEPTPDPPTLDRSAAGGSALEDLGRTGSLEDLLAVSRGMALRLPDDAARALLTLGMAVPGPVAATAACAQLCRPGLSSGDVPSLGDPAGLFPDLPGGLDTLMQRLAAAASPEQQRKLLDTLGESLLGGVRLTSPHTTCKPHTTASRRRDLVPRRTPSPSCCGTLRIFAR